MDDLKRVRGATEWQRRPRPASPSLSAARKPSIPGGMRSRRRGRPPALLREVLEPAARTTKLLRELGSVTGSGRALELAVHVALVLPRLRTTYASVMVTSFVRHTAATL
jgi:hypothetical protein